MIGFTTQDDGQWSHDVAQPITGSHGDGMVLPSTFDWKLAGDANMKRPPALTFGEDEARTLRGRDEIAVVVNALDQRGGGSMTTKPKRVTSWSPDVAAPLLAKPQGGHDSTDLDGGTWVVVDDG